MIDLPIQRERHNGWPCVFASSLKGALRERGLDHWQADQHRLFSVFGPDTNHAADHAGALNVGDARLLLLPIRSLTRAFCWVTCPGILQRLKRDANRMGLTNAFALAIPVVDNDETALATTEIDDTLYLEEYGFTTQVCQTLANWVAPLQSLMHDVANLPPLAQR